MPHRFLWHKLRRFIVYRVLSLNDTPHRIALGVAVGMFVAWTPTIPLQMVLTLALATLVGANKFVGLPFVWVSNPLTLIPVYGPSYMVGCWLTPGQYSWKTFAKAMNTAFTSFGDGWIAMLQAWWSATLSIFVPLWVGTLIVAPFVGLVSYGVTYWGVVRFRRIYHHFHDRPSEKSQPDAGSASPNPPDDESSSPTRPEPEPSKES